MFERLIPLAAFGLLLSCRADGSAPPEPKTEASGPAQEGSTAEPAAEVVPKAAGVSVGSPILLITDPKVLAQLEKKGRSFSQLVLGKAGPSTLSYAKHPRYRSITQTLEGDIAAVATKDPKAGVGMRNPHRLFDATWLGHEKTRFELISIVNRLDRRPFEKGTCGETRLIYRLAYTTEQEKTVVESRLPMTLNVVFWQPADPDGCRSAARRWVAPDGQSVAEFLTAADGPLADSRLTNDALKSVEVNLQSVRWPGTMHPSLGGHAGYVLRVFHRKKGQRLVPAPLENTPDVQALRKSKTRHEELRLWLRDPQNLRAIDEGTAVVPDRFLATSAESVTPRGLARLGNRPFSALYDELNFSGVDLSSYKTISSPAALLRRLDALSCVGCHQTRSVAGFHLVGEERRPDKIVDAVMIPSSPHVEAELARRAAYVKSVLAGETPSEMRPAADVDLNPGAYGTHCSLGKPGFESLKCNEGLICMALDDPELGICVEKGERGAGDPCEVGRMKTRLQPHRDRVVKAVTSPCARGGYCETNSVGFPQGMCAVGCGRLADDEACGAIVSLTPFNNCVARKRPFEQCIVETAGPAGMRGCDREHPCRDDYICAKTESERGACLPPYFLFQFRVDGHVL